MTKQQEDEPGFENRLLAFSTLAVQKQDTQRSSGGLLTTLSTTGHSVLSMDLISFSALLQGAHKSAYRCVLSRLAHSELGDDNLLN